MFHNHGLTFADVEKMDRWEIAFSCFHPRDEKGNLKVSEKPKERGEEDRSPRAQYLKYAASWGWPEWLAEKKWAEREKGR